MNLGEIEIHKGRPIPEVTRIGRRHPITNAFSRMEEFDSIDLPCSTHAAKAEIYSKARTAGIRVTMRIVLENGVKILRVWRIPKQNNDAHNRGVEELQSGHLP
jgi:hypothetical protein